MIMAGEEPFQNFRGLRPPCNFSERAGRPTPTAPSPRSYAPDYMRHMLRCKNERSLFIRKCVLRNPELDIVWLPNSCLWGKFISKVLLLYNEIFKYKVSDYSPLLSLIYWEDKLSVCWLSEFNLFCTNTQRVH